LTNDLAQAIETACRYLSELDPGGAAQTIISKYPFVPKPNGGRGVAARFMTRVFARDGFIDRYRGTRLIFPPVLRLLSDYLPNEFPYHKNWKMDECHPAYWELLATIDHVVPVARGGLDDETNCVCCSMLTNSIKANWTLEELQWTLHPKGNLNEWDGMVGWFLDQVHQRPALLEEGPAASYLKRWYGPAKEFIPRSRKDVP
jgi:hypothetical protein